MIEKIIQMLYVVIKPKGNNKIQFDEQSRARILELEEGVSKSELNIETIGKIVASLQKIRESNEMMIHEDAFNDGHSPKPVKNPNTAPILADNTDSFIKARLLDKINEKRPDLS